MIKQVLIYVFIAMVVALVAMWLWAGGARQVISVVKTIPNPVDIIWGTSTSTYHIDLPWQQPIPQGPDISGLVEQYADYSDAPQDQSPSESGTQRERTLGIASSYAGSVDLSQGGAEEDGATEYMELSSHTDAPVVITGWSLQSMVSGVRVFIPSAAAPFRMGQINHLAPVTLASAESIIVTSGSSPVGVSFKENRCTGYLAQLQAYTPSLANACPSASEVAPMTADNLRAYGSDCFDFLRGLPQCTFPTSVPASLSPACRNFIANAFTYNGCVSRYESSASFQLDTWRVYLGASDLWNNTHDVIRLFDAEGRTVDSITY